MGGFGTWALAALEPSRFAAIAPVCGGGKPESAKAFAGVPTLGVPWAARTVLSL